MNLGGVGLPFGSKEQFHIGGRVLARDDVSAHWVYQAGFGAVHGVVGNVEAETVG